jgi:hypothetical protein
MRNRDNHLLVTPPSCRSNLTRNKIRGAQIVDQARMFVALRKDGPALAAGRKPAYHAVTPHCRMALCATEPGAGSGWAEPPADAVTCRVCLGRLRRLKADIVRQRP